MPLNSNESGDEKQIESKDDNSFTMMQVSRNAHLMDMVHDANFGSWVKNELNVCLIATNIRKYIKEYSVPKIIIVMKWIVRDWTLKSIIKFLEKSIIIDMIFCNDVDEETEQSQFKMYDILSGIIFTWDAIFITEFLLSTSKRLRQSEAADYLGNMLLPFNKRKKNNILVLLEQKLEAGTKDEFLFRIKNKKNRKLSKQVMDAMKTDQ